MSTIPRLLAVSGSMRKGSFNTKLLAIAVEAAKAAGAAVEVIELKALNLPLYDGDLEVQEGLPEGARTLKEAIRKAQGLLIASPEYNTSISGVLKNAIDWASRPGKGETPAEVFAGKTAALLAASPSAYGGYRGLAAVRSILGNIGVLVLAEQVTVPVAHAAFEGPWIKDQRLLESIQAVAQKLAALTAKLA